VTFNSNGGGTTAGVTATYGSAMPTITPPTRTDFTFAGYWDSNDDGGSGNQYYKADGTSNMAWNKAGTSTATLYAGWTYTVAYNTNGGSGSVTTKTCAARVVCTFDTAYAGTLNNHTAKSGWATDTTNAAAGTTVDDFPATYTGGNTTVYKAWAYTVTYDTNGGSGSVTAEGCFKGGVCTFDTAYAGTLSPYEKLSGWATSEANAKTGTTITGFPTTYTGGSTTVYKSWYGTVSYDKNGGTLVAGQTAPASQTCYKGGASYTAAAQSPKSFEKANSDYENWIDGATTVNFGQANIACTGNRVWKANWKCDDHSYNDSTAGCTQCPSNTVTTDTPATKISDCYIPKDAKFCDTNCSPQPCQRCMTLGQIFGETQVNPTPGSSGNVCYYNPHDPNG